MALVGGDTCILMHVQDVDLVMGVAAAAGGRHLGGADVHAAVELEGVGVEHLDADARRRTVLPPGEGVGEVERQLRLSGGRGTDDDHADGRRAHRGILGTPETASIRRLHSSGRRGRTRLSACVHEDRAVSRWRRNWVSVTPELRSTR